MSRRLSDYDYELPGGLIAHHPLERREASRMLVLDRSSGEIAHRHFTDLPKYLRPGDLAVLNDTRVIPARARSDDGRVELLFLELKSAQTWQCMVKPGRRMKIGQRLMVGGVGGQVTAVEEDGTRIIAFAGKIDLASIGELPLPPYMERSAGADDTARYQTVYARASGAVAAPTAGLHFTPEILTRIPHAFVTLHVGAGTFRPVQVDDIAEHRMHSERYELNAETAARVNAASRVLAVGTTSVRVLETAAREGLPLRAGQGRTDIFIHPGFAFRVSDLLLTNFHLPRSTLLMLVSAFAGREAVLRAYQEAVRERYRFFSYGDCMLLV